MRISNQAIDFPLKFDYRISIIAQMVELADTPDSKSGAERREGSTPSLGTQPASSRRLGHSLGKGETEVRFLLPALDITDPTMV